MQSGLKGSGAPNYLVIGPNFGFKEDYIPEPHGKLSGIVYDGYSNRNPFMEKLFSVSCMGNSAYPEGSGSYLKCSFWDFLT